MNEKSKFRFKDIFKILIITTVAVYVALIGLLFLYPDNENLPLLATENSEIEPYAIFSTGNINAPIHISEFYNYDCIHCQNHTKENFEYFHSLVEDGTLYISYFPIGSREKSMKAYCAVQNNKFIEYHLSTMSGENTDIGTCPDTEKAELTLQKIVEVATSIQATSTPNFIVNGQPIEGYQDQKDWQLLFSKLIKEKTFTSSNPEIPRKDSTFP